MPILSKGPPNVQILPGYEAEFLQHPMSVYENIEQFSYEGV